MHIEIEYRGARRVLEIEGTSIVIGRPKKGISIDVDLTPDQKVSRPHARIWKQNSQLWIEDLDSVGGTTIGGEHIRGRGKRVLRSGTAIRIGETGLMIAEGGDAGSFTETVRQDSLPDDLEIMDSFPSPASSLAALSSFSADQIAMLCELPVQFGEEQRFEKLFQTIVERLMAVIPGATRGALLVPDDHDNLLLKFHLPSGEPSVSLTLARRAIQSKQGFIWVRGDRTTLSQLENRMASGMYAPLLWKGEPAGVICVDNSDAGKPFSPHDLKLMMAAATYVAMAVAHHKMQDDLRRSKEVVERLLTSFSPKIREMLLAKATQGRLRLGGERSDVAILMSDLRGFTRMSAGMDCEDIVEMLNEYLPVLTSAIFRYDGTVDKFIGDAILAVFGSPKSDAVRHEHATRAALEMQAGMAEINRARAARGKVTCELGIGIHSGEVLHGFIGTPDRMEFTVIGETVNLASRYCSGAKGGEILISPEIFEHVWQKFDSTKIMIPTKHEGDFPAYRVKGEKGQKNRKGGDFLAT